MKSKFIVSVMVVLFLMGCSSTQKVMKDCQHIEGDFWNCVEP